MKLLRVYTSPSSACLQWDRRGGVLALNSALHSAEFERRGGGDPGFTPGPRRISRAGGGRGSRGVPGLCAAASHSYPPPSSPLCAQTLVLCCGRRRRIKSALGLESPRGSSSSWSETLQAILNMYTVQRAGRGVGAASPAPLLASHRLLGGFVPGDNFTKVPRGQLPGCFP